MKSRAGDPGMKCQTERYHVHETSILRTWSDGSGNEQFTVIRFFWDIMV